MSLSNFHGIYTVRISGGSLIMTLPKSTGCRPGEEYSIRTTGADNEQKTLLLTPLKKELQFKTTFKPEVDE